MDVLFECRLVLASLYVGSLVRYRARRIDFFCFFVYFCCKLAVNFLALLLCRLTFFVFGRIYRELVLAYSGFFFAVLMMNRKLRG